MPAKRTQIKGTNAARLETVLVPRIPTLALSTTTAHQRPYTATHSLNKSLLQTTLTPGAASLTRPLSHPTWSCRFVACVWKSSRVELSRSNRTGNEQGTLGPALSHRFTSRNAHRLPDSRRIATIQGQSQVNGDCFLSFGGRPMIITFAPRVAVKTGIDQLTS